MQKSSLLRFLALVFFLIPLGALLGAAQNRTALVIGNAEYRHTQPLKNPKNDAVAMGTTLRKLGFNVFEGTDLTKSEMDDLVKAFAVALETSDIAVFFYAGHGLQINDRNFLLPVDAQLISPAALEFEMTRLDQIQAIMERLTSTNILIMDACRNNPLARNLARAMGTRSVRIGMGLAPAESGAGTLIAYSTQPGSVALDGEGDHSPFTEALLKFVTAKGDDLSSILINVRNDVMTSTFGKQIPWEHSALSRRFYFTPPPGPSEEPSPHPTAPSVAPDPRLELEFWSSVKDSTDIRMLNAYLDRYPQGTFSGLARLKIAELEGKVAAIDHRAAPVESIPAEPALDLKKKIQEELRRVGCYDGVIDGNWGPRSREALADFAKARPGSLAGEDADRNALDAISTAKGQVCPLNCKGATVERNGRCVAQAPESTHQQSREKPREKPKKKYTFCLDSKNLVVDCDSAEAALKR